MTTIMSSFVNALVEWRFMGFCFSIKDAHIKSCDATTGTGFQCVRTTRQITISTHKRLVVCVLEMAI